MAIIANRSTTADALPTAQYFWERTGLVRGNVAIIALGAGTAHASPEKHRLRELAGWLR
jgi:hypothetical protein